MTRVYIGLGSNIGGRRRHVNAALRELAKLPRTRLVKASSLYVTKPFGVTGQRRYINAVAAIDTELRPMSLLLQLKVIEARRGRRSGKRWAPRVLDLDILFYGEEHVRSPYLQIPHPGALERAFVIVPLGEVDPEFLRRKLGRMRIG